MNSRISAEPQERKHWGSALADLLFPTEKFLLQSSMQPDEALDHLRQFAVENGPRKNTFRNWAPEAEEGDGSTSFEFSLVRSKRQRLRGVASGTLEPSELGTQIYLRIRASLAERIVLGLGASFAFVGGLVLAAGVVGAILFEFPWKPSPEEIASPGWPWAPIATGIVFMLFPIGFKQVFRQKSAEVVRNLSNAVNARPSGAGRR